MEIKTKYDIGQIVLFTRPVKQVDGKTRKEESYVGVIKKIVFVGEGKTVKYHYITTSGGDMGYPGPVQEDWIRCRLAAQ